MPAKFPFNDLHSFKDYVTYAQTYLPDSFPPREGVGPEDQWTLDLAFDGLRHGLSMAIEEVGERQVFADCAAFIDDAEQYYMAEDLRSGFACLESVRKLLARVPTR